MNGSGLVLDFATPRYFDRMLALQLGELAPAGIRLRHLINGDPGGEVEADLLEVPLPVLVENSRQDGDLIGLPVFPSRADTVEGPLELRSVIAIRRGTYDANRWAVRPLLDAFEAARKQGWERLRLTTSPALALPWLVDYTTEDEQRFGGDPYPVGFEENREAMKRARVPLAAFAPEMLDYEASASARELDLGQTVESKTVSCRTIRYLDRSLPIEVGSIANRKATLTPSAGLKGNLPAVLEGEVAVAEVLLGDLFAEAGRGRRILGLPVITARRFAHRMIWIASGSGPTTLDSLAEGRIGFPPGAATAAAWVRELLASAGIEADFETGPLKGRLGPILDRGAEGPTLQEQVLAGDLDALVTPYRVPDENGGNWLRPLLDAPRAMEIEHASRERIVPASNVLAVNRLAVEENPDITTTVVEAFREARTAGRQGLLNEPSTVGLPSVRERMAKTEEIFGRDPYGIGIEQERDSIEAFARQAQHLGLTGEVLDLAEVFVSS